MYKQRFCIFVLLFACFTRLNAVQLSCSSDNDCSNGQGVCTSIGSSSYCSCLSGFGGQDCSVRPDSTCSFGSVSATSTTLQTDSLLSYLYPNLTLTVAANLEESKFAFPDLNDTLNVVPYSEELTIIFGNGSYTECDFPNNNVDWNDMAATAGNCLDEYLLSLAFTDAKTKCGFADTNGNRVFEQVIQINRKYQLETLRGESVSRVDTSVKTLRVIFPLEINVSTSSVQVVGSPSLLAAITLIDFDPAATPEQWTIETTTSIQSPFKLVNPSVVSSTGEVLADDRFVAASESISVLSGCGNNNQDCFQKVRLNFGAGSAPDACYGLSGAVTVQFGVVCSEGAGSNCPLIGGETVQFILNLATSDACPITEQITFSTTSLSSYSNAVATASRTSFITNQIAYFGADVQSSDALITSRNVAPGSVCFQIGNGACSPVAFTELAGANGKDPIFSVDFSDPANSAVFGFLNAADATSQNFEVHATIQVDFSGVTKKAGHNPKQLSVGSREVQLATIVKVEKNSKSAAVASVPSFILVTLVVVMGILL